MGTIDRDKMTWRIARVPNWPLCELELTFQFPNELKMPNLELKLMRKLKLGR